MIYPFYTGLHRDGNIRESHSLPILKVNYFRRGGFNYKNDKINKKVKLQENKR